jgi:hypothetical protein
LTATAVHRPAAATLLASGSALDERLGDDPRRLLEVRVGGLDLSAIASAAMFLGEREVWAGDELEVVTGSDVAHGAADALYAAVAVVALLGGAEEQAAVLMHLAKHAYSRHRRKSN